ncbi:MAG: flagellin [Planctomycetota bacterium]
MGLRVNTNIASISAQRNLENVTGRLQGNFSRLASGLRITSASDDAAGLAISERMRSQIRSFSAAGRNAQDGISLVQTAEGSLQEVSNLLSRMRELAIQAANGTNSDSDRTTIDNEFQLLIAEVDRVASQTEFNGVPLLDGTVTGLPIQVGIEDSQTIDVVPVDTTSISLGIDSASVTTIANASAALALLDTAVNEVNDARGELGASQNRIQRAYESIQNIRENLSAAESRIRDVDVALETADLSRNQIVQQASTSILQQANAQPQIALTLLQG